MASECEHGRHVDSCDVCMYQREIARLNAALARVTAQRDYFIRMVAEAVPVEIPALLHPHGLRIESGEVKEV